MKTTTMNSLVSVAPTFAACEPRPASSSVTKRRLVTIASFLTLVGVVALGFAAIRQSAAVAREMAAASSSLRLAVHGPYTADYRCGASAEYIPDRFTAEPLLQPFPSAQAWEQAGFRSL
jgi:hypothetical protein